MKKEDFRDYNIDFMRFVGILCVILAHCGPPGILFQLRDFDVPLLIVTSAMTFSTFSSTKISSARHFIIKRLIRLILPCWLFLTVYFFIVYFLPPNEEIKNPFTIYQILGSYSFFWGIGYVWILKVFAVMALLTPFLLKFRDKVKNNFLYFIYLTVFFSFNEGLIYIIQNYIHNEEIIFFCNNVFLFIIPYAVVYAYGLKLKELNTAFILILTFVSMVIFILLCMYMYLITGSITPTIDFKYPPQLYYISYALIGTNITYLLSKLIKFKGMLLFIITWVSKNSLWLYLWHILSLTLIIQILDGEEFWWLWILKFTGVFLSSSVFILVQNSLIKKIAATSNQKISFYLKLIFT